MEAQQVSQRSLIQAREDGFTFLELMAAVALLLLLASVVVVRFDLTGIRSRSELDRLRTFFRTQQMEALNRSIVRTIRVTSRERPSFRVREDENSTLELREWEISKPSTPFLFHVGPTGVYGPKTMRLRNDSGRERTLVADRLSSLREVNSPDEANP